jgi:hypothetical protein
LVLALMGAAGRLKLGDRGGAVLAALIGMLHSALRHSAVLHAALHDSAVRKAALHQAAARHAGKHHAADLPAGGIVAVQRLVRNAACPGVWSTRRRPPALEGRPAGSRGRGRAVAACAKRA